MSELYDVAVIGAGPGGYVAAIRAAQLGLKVVSIEQEKTLGGTCLNVGCIPSKALLQSTEMYWKMRHEGESFGLQAENLSYNWSSILERKEKIVSSFNEGIAGLFKKNKISLLLGKASFVSPTTVRVGNNLEVSARSFILATGSVPIALPFLPFDEQKVLSSTGALSLKKLPKKMIVVGAGIIGVELGSVYSRLGTEVIFIEFLDRICPTLDEALGRGLQQLLEKQGMKFHLSSRVTGGAVKKDGVALEVTFADGSSNTLETDVVLVCIGRKPYTEGLGLEKTGIALTPKGQVPIDTHFRTPAAHIYAIGDIVDGPMLAHKASEEGAAVAEIIAGHRPEINYMSIPNVVYTYPEIAAVGMTETEAKTHGLAIKSGSFPFKANSRARCSGEEEGFVKIIAEEGSDRVIGIHILGAHASELIAEGAIAIQKKMTALELANLPHAHPTLSEAIKEAALAVHKRPIHR